MSDDLQRQRERYAQKICRAANVHSDALVRAFATVHREDYLGPGPWRLLESIPAGYRTTQDADPRHLYRNVLVAIDEARLLNNGQPSGLATWLDALELSAGDRALHVGCGVGYYTAIIAEVVGAAGAVTGLELDPELAARSQENLAAYAWVDVHHADGSRFDAGARDAIFVNAGATAPQSHWLASLADAGRLLFPLTVATDERGIGAGWMLKITRQQDVFAARFTSPVGVYPCIGGRDEAGNRELQAAYSAGGADQVRSLRVAPHDEHPTCWLHRGGWCLSGLEPEARQPAVH
jgi:protein-L-isoaspartate(D-aspartate) O-methyltransferase